MLLLSAYGNKGYSHDVAHIVCMISEDSGKTAWIHRLA